MRGRKPKPVTSPKLKDGGLPRCPPHLDEVARKEWRRLARPLHDLGLLTVADRSAFAAYCQAYSRWAEAEERLQETPKLIKTPSGYVQQSPWISIANKQMELMGRYMSELGLTPTARGRLDVGQASTADPIQISVVRSFVSPEDRRGQHDDGNASPVQVTVSD